MRNNVYDSNLAWGQDFGYTLESRLESVERTFTGQEHTVLTLGEQRDFLSRLKDEDVSVDSIENFEEYIPEINRILGDPTWQYEIITNNANIPHTWNTRILDGTWTQTRDKALERVMEFADVSLSNICIRVNKYFSIDMPGYSTKSPMKLVGTITNNHIKSCESYPKLRILMAEKITMMINDDLAKHIESDQYKLENDMMMLKHLLNKYPDFKQSIENEERKEERKEGQEKV
jgi:hypothetical protein